MLMSDRIKRTGALLLLIAFVLMTLLSTAFIFTHADHEHDHHGPEGTCATCAQLHIAQNLLENIAFVILVLAALNVFFILATMIYAACCKTGVHTLVSLEVRLNN